MKNLEIKEKFPLNLQFFAEKDKDEDEDNKDVENLDTSNKDNEDESESDEKDNAKESKKERTFTQEQVNRMMTKEKNQGRNAVYKELGINPKDTKAINMLKAYIESQKTDEQKAAEKQNEENEKLKEAENKLMVAEAKAEAMQMGVKPQFVEDVVTLAIAKLTDDTDLTTLIGELKTKYPVWFGEDDNEEDEKKKAGQKGTGSSIKNQKEKDKSGKKDGIGARLAAQRKASNSKTSYWS